ncbi:leucine-rich repeat and death domain-containing protein 1 [Bicyclus anynana]|uniref:Leucine-rich repeat and death domain-containing protein 1 n=1 Tax=Bicyclus anynana TaxID=110368 RepID=A0A6J1P4T4_BICAN|nr:leucine-rich repeat and death domain-containing protein 1 [Bicyclus anynana]
MEEVEEKTIEKNGLSSASLLLEHLKILDLSNRGFETIDENVKLPINLTELNLSNNKLSEVPISVLNLENLKVLDLSHNCIKYFDVTPKFCHTIQSLNMANNDLNGPPHWVWSEAPTTLEEINLSCNLNITKALQNLDYYKELLDHKVLITNIILYNCKLGDHMELLSTFPNTKSCILGTNNFSSCMNDLEEVPCNGINKCCDVEYLNLCNTNILNVNTSIEIYRKLREINLAQNKLQCLPEQFCLLENLEICILSYNCLYSLPANFCELRKLTSLSVDYNELFALPTNICQLPNIKKIDAYDNFLYEVPDGLDNLLEVDLAQNCLDEPNNEEYFAQRKRIRAISDYRLDGRKEESSVTDCSESKTDDDISQNSKRNKHDIYRCSSSEEWDSDDYWVPQPINTFVPHHYWSTYTPEFMLSPSWTGYIRRKIEEEILWPINAQTLPMADQFRCKEMYHTKACHESDGQFDDFSDDNS